MVTTLASLSFESMCEMKCAYVTYQQFTSKYTNCVFENLNYRKKFVYLQTLPNSTFLTQPLHQTLQINQADNTNSTINLVVNINRNVQHQPRFGQTSKELCQM